MSNRLWFRLDDVLPLAEHAMACTAHRFTGAHARGLAPLRPALIWTGTTAGDALASNGLPGWFGEHGDVHTARARTWRRTSTGHLAVAGRPDYWQAVLPLEEAGTYPGGVIGLLRDARRTGRHWVTIDIDPADRHVIAAHRVRAVAYRDDLVPAGCRWLPADVTCHAVAGASYPALLPDGYTTDHGYEIVRFDRDTVAGMVADLHTVQTNPDMRSDSMPGEYPHLRWVDDVLVVSEEIDDAQRDSLREVDRVRPDSDGYYPVGAYLWPWQRAVTR